MQKIGIYNKAQSKKKEYEPKIIWRNGISREKSISMCKICASKEFDKHTEITLI